MFDRGPKPATPVRSTNVSHFDFYDIGARFCAGQDTREIADALDKTEAVVANALPEALAIYRRVEAAQ